MSFTFLGEEDTRMSMDCDLQGVLAGYIYERSQNFAFHRRQAVGDHVGQAVPLATCQVKKNSLAKVLNM